MKLKDWVLVLRSRNWDSSEKGGRTSEPKRIHSGSGWMFCFPGSVQRRASSHRGKGSIKSGQWRFCSTWRCRQQVRFLNLDSSEAESWSSFPDVPRILPGFPRLVLLISDPVWSDLWTRFWGYESASQPVPDGLGGIGWMLGTSRLLSRSIPDVLMDPGSTSEVQSGSGWCDWIRRTHWDTKSFDFPPCWTSSFCRHGDQTYSSEALTPPPYRPINQNH